MKLDADLTLSQQGKMFANPRRIELLRQIAQHGSISQAAKQSGMSYKAAWDAVNDMNSRLEVPLVDRVVGGKGGGGAALTPFGERLLKLHTLLTQIQTRALASLQDETVVLDSLLGAISQFAPQSSARNQYFARVTRIQPHAVTARIGLQLAADIEIYAEVTHRSSARLKLAPGQEVLVMLKAPAVVLQRETKAAEGINRLRGDVLSWLSDGVNTAVVLAVSSGLEICALMAADQVDALDLQRGQRLVASFDPEQVLLATLS